MRGLLHCSCDRVRLAGTLHCVTSCAAHVLLRAWCPILGQNQRGSPSAARAHTGDLPAVGRQGHPRARPNLVPTMSMGAKVAWAPRAAVMRPQPIQPEGDPPNACRVVAGSTKPRGTTPRLAPFDLLLNSTLQRSSPNGHAREFNTETFLRWGSRLLRRCPGRSKRL